MSKIYRIEDFAELYGQEKAEEIFGKILADEFLNDEEEEDDI